MKHRLLAAGFALLAAVGLGQVAQAAPVDFTHDYGTGPGQVAPMYGTGGTMAADHVLVLDRLDSGGNRFYDEIDFSGFSSVSSLTLTLSFSSAGPSGFLNLGENWSVYGTTNGGTNADTDRVTLGNLSGNSWTRTFSSGSVFNQALSSGSFAFWFGDGGIHTNDFMLDSATLTVDGAVAPIPLPAAGMLLIGAMGGLAFIRRIGGGGTAL